MNVSLDDRRLGLFDIFGTATPGQVNVVKLYPGAICAWHRHQRQTDYYLCVAGTVKVGMIRGGQPSWVVLDEHYPAIVEVPPPAWHGYQNIGTGDAVLVQYLDHKYDPTDEERASVQLMAEEVGARWERIAR